MSQVNQWLVNTSDAIVFFKETIKELEVEESIESLEEKWRQVSIPLFGKLGFKDWVAKERAKRLRLLDLAQQWLVTCEYQEFVMCNPFVPWSFTGFSIAKFSKRFC